MKEIIKTCPKCACDTLHVIKMTHLMCYNCYSCDYHKDVKFRYINQIKPLTLFSPSYWWLKTPRITTKFRRVPIEIWSELTKGSISLEVQEWRKLAPTPPYQVCNSGGRTYLVTQNIKKES